MNRGHSLKNAAGAVSALIFAALAGGDALVEARAENAKFDPHEALLRVIGTKETDVDLDGDGRADLNRRYDESGALVWSQSTDYLGDQPFRLVYELKRFPRQQRQVIEMTWFSPGSQEVVRTQQDLLTDKGVLLRRESRWKSQMGKPFDLMMVQVPRDDVFAGELFQLDRATGKWVSSRKVRTPLAYLAQNPARVRQAERERNEGYLSCRLLAGNTPSLVSLTGGGRTYSEWESDCRDRLSALPDVVGQMEEFNLPGVMPPACNAVTQYYLESGFTIDKISCANSAAGIRNPDDDPSIRRIKAATESVVGPMLSCLNELNPRYARQFAVNVARKRPVIRCGGNHGPPGSRGTSMAEIVRDDVCRPNDSTCRGFFARNSGVGAAFFEDHPGELFLMGQDPNNFDLASQSAEATERQQAGALASTIFHEMLHSCGHMGGPGHNHPSHPHQDDVYGCQGACGYLPDGGGAPVNVDQLFQVSREGCMRCAQANGNVPSERARARCDALPTQAAVEAGHKAFSRVKDAALCVSRDRLGATGNRACERLRADPVVRQACGRNPDFRNQSCIDGIVAAGAAPLRELMDHEEMGRRLRALRESCRGSNGDIGMDATGRSGCLAAQIIFVRILNMTDADS